MNRENSVFNRMLRGEVPPPPVVTLLGGHIEQVDVEAGSLRARYEGAEAFRNPAGQLQGGMLCAMLDDLCGAMVDATVEEGQAVATLNLNVSFLRPAVVGRVQGEARVLKRGREIAYVEARLLQNDKPVATATATCKVVALR